MKKAITLFVFFIILGFGGCRKEPDTEPLGPLLIPQELKEYTYFKPGTYWVYIDSVSGRVDSQYVYETTHSFDTLSIQPYAERVYEIFVVKAHSVMDGYNYYFEVNTTYSVNNNSLIVVFEEKLKPGDYKGRSIMFIYKPIKGQIIYDHNATKHINDIYDSLSLSGVNYKNVIDVSYDISAVDVSKNVRKFIASNYGIVRKEYADSNQVWILARSNIIQ